MPTWIRFRYDHGDTTMVNAENTHLMFKAEERKILVFPFPVAISAEALQDPICQFDCEYAEQVAAAEELIFDGLSNQRSVTISLEVLDEHAEYLNNVHGIRMILTLLHQGSIRIPHEDGLTDHEVFDLDEESSNTEISQFENMLHTYLNVPSDALQRALRLEQTDSPFGIQKDHEECPDHGFHEYWVVRTLPDCNYDFREDYTELAHSLMEKEGYGWTHNG